jgi:hypothetical protein
MSLRGHGASAFLGTALAVAAVLCVAAPAASAAPTVSVEPVTTHSIVTARMKGTIATDEAAETYWGFQYRPVLEGEAAANQGPEDNWQNGPQNFAGPFPPETTNPVEDTLTGLSAATEYEVRLFAFPNTDFEFHFDPPPGTPGPTFTTDPAPVAPLLAIEPVDDPTDSAATIAGSVDPEGGNVDAEAGPVPILWRLQYTTEPGNPEAWTTAAEETLTEGAAESPDPIDVSVALTGLAPATEYAYRLTAAYAGIQATSAVGHFATDALPPTLGPEVASPGGAGEVTVRGFVNPHNSTVTDCHFEYGLTGSYGQSVPCEGDPNGPGVVDGLPGPPARVSAILTGLTPGATYHYRLVADNGVGPAVEGPDRTVDAPASLAAESCPNAGRPGAGFLPDCRAWELVSPIDKNGGDILADSGRTRAATDGNAVAFASLTAFGDAVGTGVSTDYMALRGTDPDPGDNGWSSHALTPPQKALSVNGVLAANPLYEGDFSADLSHGVFRAWTPLTKDPDVADVANLYTRDDLRAPGTGSYQLVTSCPLCGSTSPLPPLADPTLVPVFAGASADFRHIAFEVRGNLTADAPAQPAACASEPFSCQSRAYDWSDGQLRLTGVVPGESDISCGGVGPACVPAPISISGQGVVFGIAPRPVNVVSADGSRVFFTVPVTGNSGRLYVRVDDTKTDELSASERTDCAGDPSCGGDDVADPAPDAFRPATYWGASVDGSRVFFTSAQALTDDAPTIGDRSLYMYDTTKPASDPHNLTYLNPDAEPGDSSNDVQAVIGTSDDGHYVYFLASGQLVPGAPRLGVERGIYLWHDGQISYVGQTLREESGELPTTGTNYHLRPPQGRVSADGRNLLFSAHDGGGFATAAGHGDCQNSFGVGCRELYDYSAATDELKCVSCPPAGTTPHTEATTGIQANTGAAPTSWHLSRAVSADGSRAFFTTAEALLPQDTNGARDAYEYDTRTATLHLLSSGTDPSDSYFIEAGPSGEDAFILTRQRLAGWDTDSAYDLYDARVDGGFPEPAVVPAPCAGESCHHAAPVPPPAAAPGSAAFAGPTNPKHRCHKAKHAVRRHGKTRCVRRHKQHKRQTNANRGASK